MNKQILIRIIVAVVSVAAVTGIGAFIYNTKQAAAQVEVQAEQPTESVSQSVVADLSEEPDYESEALGVYQSHKAKLNCDYTTFEDYYVNLRESGSDKSTATKQALANFLKVEEPASEEPTKEVKDNVSTNLIQEKEVEEPKADYEVIDSDETTMYAKSTVNTRSLPSTDGDQLGKLQANQSVQVIGYVKQYKGEDVLWYLLKDKSSDGQDQFVNGGYLLTKQPTTATTASNSNTNNNSTATTTTNANTTTANNNTTVVQQEQPQVQITQQTETLSSYWDDEYDDGYDDEDTSGYVEIGLTLDPNYDYGEIN